MSKADAWELVVIGGGSAGLTAARTARLLGARVLLIEAARLGGDCLWTGCVPSKALIAEARNSLNRPAAEVRAVSGVFDAVTRARDRIAPTDSAESLAQIGVEVVRGRATLRGREHIDVDGTDLVFERAIVATGSMPVIPEIPGLNDLSPLTSDTIWDLAEIPENLLILGGGAIGCELGQALGRLGARVTIVQRGPEILQSEEPRARSIVTGALKADGVRILTGRQVKRFEREAAGGGTAVLDDGARLAFDRILLAAGRRARVEDLGLAEAAIRMDDSDWVVTDSTLRTTNGSVWAAGDVAGLPKHTHTAGVSGAIAARNALLGTKKAMVAAGQPQVVFTAPEVASVGVQASGRDRARHRVVTVPHRRLDRAITEDETTGFTQLIIDRRGRILGGTIVGPRAGESVGEVALAVGTGLTVSDVAGVTHPYPTFNDGVWNAAIVESQRRMREGVTGWAAGILRRVHRKRDHAPVQQQPGRGE